MIHLNRFSLSDPDNWQLFYRLMDAYLQEVCLTEDYCEEIADLNDDALNTELITQSIRPHDPYFVMRIMQGEDCIGLITYTYWEQEQTGFINNFYICPEQRGKGLGGQAYDLAERHLLQLGALSISLEPEHKAVPFYLRKGYSPGNDGTFHKTL